MENKKIVYLINHSPNPRINRRIKISCKIKDLYTIVIYLNRKKHINYPFIKNSKVKYIPIQLNDNNKIIRAISMILVTIKIIIILRKNNPLIIHCEKLDMLLISNIFKTVFKSNCRIIYEVADIQKIYFDKFSLFWIRLQKNFIRKIESLILTSQKHYDEFFSNYIESKKVLVIPNINDPNLFKDIRIGKIRNKELTVGFIGNIRYTEEIIKFINIVNRLDNVKFKIYGGGYEFRNIENFIDEKKIFYYGTYNYELDIKKIYESFDVTYIIYPSESINAKMAVANKYYESLICGKPMIVSNGTYLSELVEKYKTGYAISIDDSENIKKVLAYFNNNKIYDELVNNCVKTSKGLNPLKSRKKLSNLYKKFIYK
jgi:succinoglycan biosynthesis protein ExoL